MKSGQRITRIRTREPRFAYPSARPLYHHFLTGKAAKLYTSLPSSTTEAYELLKQALLTGFSKTPDGYRVDFRSNKIRVGENYNQFVTQLSRMFDSWVESSSVDNAYADLRKFIIFDEFLSSLSPELHLLIKERRSAKLKDAIQLADDWASTDNAYPKVSFYNSKKIFPRLSTPPQSLASSVSQTPSTVTCHNCGEVGHIRSRCPRNPRAFKDETTTMPPIRLDFV